jgi:hypothetical protein
LYFEHVLPPEPLYRVAYTLRTSVLLWVFQAVAEHLIAQRYQRAHLAFDTEGLSDLAMPPAGYTVAVYRPSWASSFVRSLGALTHSLAALGCCPSLFVRITAGKSVVMGGEGLTQFR